MMQTISKMESYAAGNGYRPYGMSSSIRPRPFYPVPMPMGSVRRSIYRLPPYIPTGGMRMSPSMRMPMYMPPRAAFGMRSFRPSIRSPLTAASMAQFSSRPRSRGSVGMGSFSRLGAGVNSFSSLSSMGDMSAFASLGDSFPSEFTSGSDGLFDSPGDISSALSSSSEADEYKLNGDADEYKLGDEDDKSEYSMESDTLSGDEGASLDASKLGEGTSMTLDDSSDMRVKHSNAQIANAEVDDVTSDDAAASLSAVGDSGAADDEDETSGKLSKNSPLETPSTDDLMPHLPVISGSSKKSSKNKKSSRSKKNKSKKVDYKAMYEMIKAYNDEKRDSPTHDYNSGDNEDNNNNEYVTMYRNQVNIIPPSFSPMVYMPIPNVNVSPSSLPHSTSSLKQVSTDE